MVVGEYPFQTLPDYLRSGLDIVFVGINPGLYSVEQGHYFARRTTRFWRAFSSSKLSEHVRHELGANVLGPEHDSELPRFGIGLTDVVKRPTPRAAELNASDFEQWAPSLLNKLQRYEPRVACFHGVTGYRPFLDVALKRPDWKRCVVGLQPEVVGVTRLYVTPNPSPANAHCSVADLTKWYDCLADFLLRI